MDSKRILILARHAPYGSNLAREAIDAALATGVFDSSVSLLFTGEGVWQLQPGQQAAALGQKNIGQMLGALGVYDIDQVYADASALAERGMGGELAIPVQRLAPDEIARLITDHDVVLSL